MLCATLLNSLPKSYDGLVLAIQSRREDEININTIKSVIMEEYRRRSACDSAGNAGNSDAALKIIVKGNQKATNSAVKKLTCHFYKKPGHFKRDCQKYNRWKTDHGNNDGGSKHGANCIQQSNDKGELLFLVGKTDGWILDSGATCHIGCNRSDFIKLDETQDEVITMANGDEVQALGRGKVRLYLTNAIGESSRVLMNEVLFVPSIETNLVSVK